MPQDRRQPGRTLAFSTPSSPPFASWKVPPRVRGGSIPRSEKRNFPHPHWHLVRLPRPAGENRPSARLPVDLRSCRDSKTDPFFPRTDRGCPV